MGFFGRKDALKSFPVLPPGFGVGAGDEVHKGLDLLLALYPVPVGKRPIYPVRD